ncbi:MAG: hypothetical protein ACLP4V_09470, partial [Methylocella sp.]
PLGPLGVLQTYARQPFYHVVCLSSGRPAAISLAGRKHKNTGEDAASSLFSKSGWGQAASLEFL